VWWVEWPDPLSPATTLRSTLGIYDHPSTLPYVTSVRICDTWTAKVGEYATSYAVKTAIWLRGLGL
jgi:hypothetical protein